MTKGMWVAWSGSSI